MREINLVRENPFASHYFLNFTSTSFSTHASATAVSKIIVGDPPELFVGTPKPISGPGGGPYGLAIALIGNVLLVASVALNLPPADAVIDALNTE